MSPPLFIRVYFWYGVFSLGLLVGGNLFGWHTSDIGAYGAMLGFAPAATYAMEHRA